MDFCISLSTKQGNSGRLAVTQADWIMSLVFRFQVRFFKIQMNGGQLVTFILNFKKNFDTSTREVHAHGI